MRKALALTLTLVFFWSGIAAPANNSRARVASQDDDTTTYKVIVNHEEQYSIWPADRENALGWNDVGKTGTKAECLAYIKEISENDRPNSPLARTERTTGPTPPPGEFRLPGIGQNGHPVQIFGPFDGNVATTEITIGGKPVQPLAESSRSCFFISPNENPGPAEIRLTERGVETKGAYRNLGVRLTAPKTSLLKGEKTTVTIEISGLKGIQKDVPLELGSTGVINMEGGNSQHLTIRPSDVQSDGNFTTARGITGLTAGGFTVTATVIDSDRKPAVGTNVTVMTWTSLSKSDIEDCLKEGGTVQPQGKGYLVTGIKNPAAFGVNLGLLAQTRNVDVPRFSRPGQRDPGPPSKEMRALGLAFAGVVANIMQGAAGNFRGPWPVGPLPNPRKVAEMLNAAGIQLDGGQQPARPKGPGRWMLVCNPGPPCVRPEEPKAQDVPDCAAEYAEISRVQEWLDAYNNSIDVGKELLAQYLKAQSISQAVDVTVAVLTIAAIATGPLGFMAGAAFAAPALIVDFFKQLLFDNGLQYLIDYIKAQLEELARQKAFFEKALAEALAALEACLKKAAEAAEAANAAAWQNYFNVLLPEFYKCLDARRCRRVWVPN